MSKSFDMNFREYERSTDILKGLGNPMRLLIIQKLISKGPLNVTELWRTVELPQSTVSQHLIKLKALKVVMFERKGLEVYYRVDDPTVIEVVKTLGL